MAKRPEAGRTKTRLIPALAPEQAAQLAECFLLDAVATTSAAARVTEHLEVQIAGAPIDSEPYFRAIAPECGFAPQVGFDLSERLDHVLSSALAAGFNQVAAINSDSPTLPHDYVTQAFAELDRPDVDVVFGPTEDGGYYLIGVKNHHPRLVREVEMSTPSVLEDSLAIAQSLGLSVALLPVWHDIDEPGDLERLRHEVANGADCGPATRAFLEGRP